MLRRFLILLILLILFLVGIGGCLRDAVGPFVTNISYDGEGNLIVTKNMIIFDRGSGTLSNGENPQTIVIKAAIKGPPTSK